MPREDEYFGTAPQRFDDLYAQRNEIPEEQEYKAKAMEQAMYFGQELYDIAIRYNLSIVGDVERSKGIENGPLKLLNQAINALELLKQSI